MLTGVAENFILYDVNGQYSIVNDKFAIQILKSTYILNRLICNIWSVWIFKVIFEPFGVDLLCGSVYLNHLGLICYVAVYIDSSSEQDVTDIYDRIPIVQAPRQVRRYRRNADMLGPVVGQRLRNRR